MNDLTKSLTSSFLPKMAVIVYHNDQEHDYYIEQRPIMDGVMGAGIPFTNSTMLNILNRLKPKKEVTKKMIGGPIPSNLLYFSHDEQQAIWYRGPEKRMMYFTENLNIQDGERMMPGLIYRVQNGRMDIFAYEGELNDKTQLYFAPFMNATGNSICLGSAKVDDSDVKTYEDYILYWEKMFWMSTFSHSGSTQLKVNMVALLKELLETGKPFPVDVIIKSNKKFKSLFS